MGSFNPTFYGCYIYVPFSKGHDLGVQKLAHCESFRMSSPFIHAKPGIKVLNKALKACNGKPGIEYLYFGLGTAVLVFREDFQEVNLNRSRTEYKARFLTKTLLIYLLGTLDKNDWVDWDVNYSIQ